MLENSMIVGNAAKLTREEWLDKRRGYIGGSDASVCVGLNPYRSLAELYADKKGLLPDREENEAIRLGRDLEEYVAQRFCEATGKKVRRDSNMYVIRDKPFIGADIDRRVIGENAILECKTTNNWGKNDFDGGEIPPIYYCQCLHYLEVTGAERCYLAVLIFGRGFYWFVIERNEREQKALIDAETFFWKEYIEKDKTPAPDGTDSAQIAVNALFGGNASAGTTISIFECADAVKAYIALDEQIKALQKEQDAYKQQLQVALGENECGETDLYRVTWKTQQRTTIDSKMVKERHPEVYAECSKTSTSRVFRATNIKRKEV